MIQISTNINSGQLSKLSDAFSKYAEAIGGNVHRATYLCAIAVVRSLKAATRKAPTKVPLEQYEATRSRTEPIYKSDKDAGPDKQLQRRWHINRNVRGKQYDIFVPATFRKKGKVIVKDEAGERREVARKMVIRRAGLAKLTWDWVGNRIRKSGAKADPVWLRRKREIRNPRLAVAESSFTSSRQTTETSASAHICNKLDYIEAAMDKSVDEVLETAERGILHRIEKMTKLK